MKRYTHTFRVTGTTPFPIDMLRYDNCRPLHEVDSHVIEETINGTGDYKRRVVNVRTINSDRSWNPTVGRWKSLGWHVDLDSLQTTQVPG